MDSLCHPWFTTTNLSYRFLFLKLPPPPCAVLLVHISSCAEKLKRMEDNKTVDRAKHMYSLTVLGQGHRMYTQKKLNCMCTWRLLGERSYVHVAKVKHGMPCLMSGRRCTPNILLLSNSFSIFLHFQSIHFTPLHSTALYCAPLCFHCFSLIHCARLD